MVTARRTDVRLDALNAAREMAPLITRMRDETEADRRIARPVVDALVETRLCRMALGAELEGLELPISAALDVCEVLAAAEPSVSWIVWNNAATCLFERYLDRSGSAEVFEDPSWMYASSTRPTGQAAVERDGYRVSGQWSLVSGCELAEWILLMCVVTEGGQPRSTESGAPELRMAYIRRADCTILDTWHVGGLRGTGSHDVVVSDRFVPARRTLAPFGPGPLDRPLRRVPIVGTLAVWFGAQTLGIAQKCVDAVVELVKTKVSPDPGPLPRDRPAVQEALATENASLEAARSHLRATASRFWDAASAGAAPTLEGITSLLTAGHHAVGAAKRAVDRMYAAGGSSSLYVSSPLERAHRDLHAMLQHIIAQRFWIEDAGRVMLGLAPESPLYSL